MASSSSSESKKKITLKSSDGEQFEVEEEVAIQSKTIKHILEEISGDVVIPLPNVTAKILSKVIEYCKKHADSEESVEYILWVTDFLEIDQDTLFDLMLAANYLNISRLLDLTCKSVADTMRGKSIDEIRSIYHIVNDYSPEEEAEIKKDFSWAFE